jgi:hypothetical protein
MKIKLFILLILCSIVILQCSVNNSTGLISILNSSNQDLKNVKIGDTFIALNVSSGSKVDFWYIIPFKGKFTFEGNYEFNQKDVIVDCNLNYMISISAYNLFGKDSIVISSAEKGEEWKIED